MTPNITIRPYRFLWTTAWTIVAVVLLGWLALLPMLAIQFDVEFKK
ncbi:MAG: hypothetical protein ACXABY_22300 [Candidatus Thorarchaeota archaeon]|jgi:hypothetical protein